MVKLPAGTVKIDRGLINEINEANPSNPVLFAVVSMVRNLGKDIVAEGIETPFQHQGLAGLNVNTMQGYHYARPMPAEECLDFVQNFDLDKYVN